MGNCNACSGNCGSCGGCAKELVLTQQELELLKLLGEVAFLPVARTAGEMTPYCLELSGVDPEEGSLILQCLEKKGLIDLDYRMPLKGFQGETYRAYPVWGSMGLTARGQSVLELAELQGIAAQEI